MNKTARNLILVILIIIFIVCILFNSFDNSQYIYILKLQKDKYYVGKSFDVQKRFLEHNLRKGFYWTSIYKLI